MLYDCQHMKAPLMPTEVQLEKDPGEQEEISIRLCYHHTCWFELFACFLCWDMIAQKIFSNGHPYKIYEGPHTNASIFVLGHQSISEHLLKCLAICQTTW